MGLILPPAILAGSFCVILTARLANRNRLRAFFAASFFAFSILGILSFSLHQNPGILAGLEQSEARLTGRIASHPQAYAEQQHFSLSASKIEKEGITFLLRETVKVRAAKDIRLVRDDTITAEGSIHRGYMQASEIMPAESDGFFGRLYEIRKRAYACLKDSYNHNLGRNFAPVCKALVLGNRSGIPKGLAYDFAGAGIYHVLAISGLHISILAFFLMHILKKAPAWVAFLAILGIMLLFNLMVGLRASLLRATSMMLMIMLARTWGRHYRIADILFTTFAFLLLLVPYYFSDVGFWFSFVSFSAIIFINPLLESFLGWPRNYFLKIITVSFSIWLATFPLNAYFFGMVSIAGVISNAAILPVFYVFMVMLFFISALIIAWPGLGGLLVIVKPLLSYITGAAHQINKLDFLKMDLADFPVQAAVIYYVLLLFLLLLLYKYIKARKDYGQK